MGYDKQLFVENIYELAKLRGLKIKDLEAGCGISVGYISRLRQGEKNIAPGADFLLAIAQQLSVSVDALLTCDFVHATPSEIEAIHFIDKLLRETQARKLSWQEDLGGYQDTVPVNPDGSTPHPLYFSSLDKSGKPVVSYHSMFHADFRELVPVKVYGCVFPGSRTLYLVHVWNTGDSPSSPDEWEELELVMTGRGILDPIPLAHTNHDQPGRLDASLELLFDAVQDAAAMPAFTPEALEIIRDYLNEESDTRDAEPDA